VFNFYPDDRYCHGFEEVLARYREIVPHLKLAGLILLPLLTIFYIFFTSLYIKYILGPGRLTLL